MPLIELRLWSGGAAPFWGFGVSNTNFQDFLLTLHPESTCKWHCNIKSNSHSGCKNEQRADFEVKLENIITDH